MRNRYRNGAVFVLDLSKHTTLLDRNARARLLHKCEILERATKPAGCRNGAIGVPGLQILRTLLLRYHHAGSGLCFPSYTTLMKATGLCRQSVANAIKRLEALGILRVTRRLVRYVNEIGVLMCAQGSNLYQFAEPSDRIDLGPATQPARMCRSFPRRVYQIGGNYEVPQRSKPSWMGKGALQGGELARSALDRGNWRERARRLLKA